MHLVETLEDATMLELPDTDKLALLTQTTLSIDDTRAIVAALQRRFPQIQLPSKDDVCYATQNRQNAVKTIAASCELVLVVGAATSSNSNRLVEVARAHGARAHLVEDAAAIEPAWLESTRSVGVTAGASTPEFLVEEVVRKLRSLGYPEPEHVELVREDIRFALPLELKRDLAV